jgi:hypothetical protein
MAGFFHEYTKWSGPPGIAAALAASRDQPVAFRTVTAAYLHVAYDLPRVIADALRSFKGSVSDNDHIGSFLQLQEPLRAVLLEAGKDVAIMGYVAPVIRWLPGRSHFLTVFGNWVLVLRSNAYHRAQMLRRMKPADRPAAESALLSAVALAIVNVSRQHPRNPIAWVARLDTWFGIAALPVVLAQSTVGFRPQWAWPTLGLVATTMLGGLLAYAVLVDRWLASYADELGAAVQEAMSNIGGGRRPERQQGERGRG